MIIFVTGVPGAGKTLFTVAELPKEWEGRPIFQCGIDGLKLGWSICDDPRKWEETLPANAVLVIDEAQKWFPVRPPTQVVPKYIEQLTTHRHLGVDIVMITQNGGLVDSYIRRLCGRHIHLHRALGLQAVTVFQWDVYEESTNSPARQAVAVRSRWAYPKEAFGLYKSAEVHTGKRRIPKFLYALPALVAVPFISMWVIGKWASDHVDPKAAGAKAAIDIARGAVGTGLPGVLVGGVPSQRVQSEQALADPMAEALKQVNEVAAFPWKDQRFAKLDEPKRAPHVYGCVRNAEATKCVCYSDRAELLKVDAKYCSDYVEGAVFAYWAAAAKEGVSGAMSRAQGQASSVPIGQPVVATVKPGFSDVHQEASITIPVGAPVTVHKSSSFSGAIPR